MVGGRRTPRRPEEQRTRGKREEMGQAGEGGAPPESTSGSRTPGRKADRREENVQRTEITSTEKKNNISTL